MRRTRNLLLAALIAAVTAAPGIISQAAVVDPPTCLTALQCPTALAALPTLAVPAIAVPAIVVPSVAVDASTQASGSVTTPAGAVSAKAAAAVLADVSGLVLVP